MGQTRSKFNSTIQLTGFEGKKCEKLSSISLQERDSYVSLLPLQHRPRTNVTLVLSTHLAHGVILYQGFDEHLAVEIFRGRLRVSYNIGNHPVSTMFSYEQVNDGKVHVVELLTSGKNMTMRVDGGLSRTIINEGELEFMELEEPLYLGGLPAGLKEAALKKWHFRNTVSFNGMSVNCYS